MRGWVPVGVVLVLLASLSQHSSLTAQLRARRATLGRHTATPRSAPELRPGVGGVPGPLPRWPASELAPVAVGKQGAAVVINPPYIYAAGVLVGVFFFGGPLPPDDFLELDPDSARNIQALILVGLPQTPLPQVGLMSNLLFLLSDGSFKGTIPSEIALCTALLHLSLDDMEVTGPLPSQLGLLSTLQDLFIQASGVDLSIPSELCQLSSMQRLLLYGSSFSGAIPPCILASLPLTSIRLVDTNLGETIPPVGVHPFVSLHGNRLAGPLPDISALLESTIPPYLAVHSNHLSGTIPTQYGLLPYLLVSDNLLEGTVPVQIGLQRAVFYIRANHNALSGPIPSQLGLTPLIQLEFGNNALTGTIPSQLGQLWQLWELGLNSNHFEGPIPSELGLLTRLSLLDLSDNDLSGTLPSQLLLLTNLGALHIGGNALSGPLVAPPNARVACDYSGIDHPSCLTETFAFVGDDAFAAVVAGASGNMALELLIGAWLVVHRNLEGVERFGLAVGLLTVGGVFVTSSSAVWFALASVHGSHNARSSYCRAALHSVVLGMHLIVVPCAVHVGLAWLSKRRLSLELLKSWRASPKRVVLLVGLSFVPVVAITTAASVGVEASRGPGCDSNGPSLVLALFCPAVLAAVACVTSAVSLAIRDDDHHSANIAHMRRALGTNALFAVALAALAPNLQEPLPRFLSLSLAALVSAATFTAIVHVPLVRGKWVTTGGERTTSFV